ncbi:MAG: COQ9 family protein [Pseudomonadota bacterium]
MQALIAGAAFDGFSPISLELAATSLGEQPELAKAAFPGGVTEALALWSADIDEACCIHLAGLPEDTKIREKVKTGVAFRLEYLQPTKEAARRAAATLALPQNVPLSTKLVWNSADVIWRGIGDTSTDINFYSKRTILAGVLSSTLAKWFTDDDADFRATTAFLDDRIENVMSFEKIKSRLPSPQKAVSEAVSILAGLRYRS